MFVNERPSEQAQAAQSQTVQQPQNGLPDTAPVMEGPVDSQSIPPVENQSLPPVETEPEVALYINAAGKNYGPYDWKMCKKLVEGKQLSERTTVWMKGMAAWQSAGTVEVLKPLFAPASSLPPVETGPVNGDTPPASPSVM